MGNGEMICMEIALSFSDAEAARIKNYAAKRNMSVPDFVKRAVRKSVDEEAESAAKSAEYTALEKLRKELEGAGEAIGLDSDEAVAAWVTESRRKERLTL